MKKLERIKKKIKENEHKSKRLESSLKRKKRAKKLIKLGTLFEIENLVKEDKNLLLGYLIEFQLISEIEKEKLKIQGNRQIEESRLEKIESLEILEGRSYLEKKKRLHELITVGALFEKVKIHKEDPRILLGYLIQLKTISLEKRNRLKQLGKKEFEKTQKARTTPTKEEILDLFKLYMINSKDLMQEIWKKYQTRNLNSLTFSQYEFLYSSIKSMN
ncbi:MAG: conjugal transfer protein TraD [Cetobacterium sp.]|uniref:conjugal transfer protein TraD n=1 Tax=Cetobacterium sp. TaxID=2071632 RepID=UPI003EE55A38